MVLSHSASCGVADGTVTAVVRPSDWNAAHTVAAGTTGYGLVPVGGIVNWAGLLAALPTGYLLCNGASLLRAGTYAGLFGAIDVIFGSADGTHFTLPDLRDRFVVGGKQDDGNVVKSNIRGSLEQSLTVTAISLTHDGSIVDHTGLTHAGASLANHPDLTHAALGLADHAAYTGSVTISDHGVATRVYSMSNASIVTSLPAHTITHMAIAALTHNVSAGGGTHVGTDSFVHAVSQPAAHGAAGTVSHAFTPPVAHATANAPAFLALGYLIRYA